MPEPAPLRIVFRDAPSPAAVRTLAEYDASGGVEIDFDVEDLPPEVIAALVDAVDHWLQAGRAVQLMDAPQMLAHTLYKVGRLKKSRLLTVTVQDTEPYPG
jgi:hypothetical protein